MDHGVTTTLGAFIEFEERMGLWELEAAGQRYWHQIRFHVYNEVLRSRGLVDQAQRSWRDRKLSDWLANVRPRHWPHAVERSLWRDMDQADVLIINHPRHVREGEQWVCPYTQPLLAGFSPSYWVMEDVWQGIHNFPQPDFRLKYLEWQVLVAQAAFVLRHAGAGLSPAERRSVLGWQGELSRTLGGAPSPERALGMVRGAVREVGALSHVYERLLDRARPRLVVMVVHYSYRCLPLTTLARERGIPVAELQHGTLGPGTPAYNLARHPAGFPDYLLTWGDWWRDSTPSLPIDPSHAPAIGNAWLERHLARRTAPKRGERPRVLFVSQGTIGKSLSRMAVALVEAGSLDVRYKLHPGEYLGWRERYPWLVGSSIEVIDTPSNIYDEFIRADVAVGVYSTAMYEAVAFGLPVVLAELYGLEHMQGLLDLGCAQTVADVDALGRAIRDAQPPSPAQRERLWKPNPVDNFRRFVASMI